jgi:hypothetical protein
MKSIYLVALMVFLVIGIAAISIGGMDNITGAFSMDMSGFSIGSFSIVPLELKVYKVHASNPEEACNLTLFRGANDVVQETGKPAVAASPLNPAWTANIPGATWIWNTSAVTDPRHDQAFTFVREFNWTGDVESAALVIASDNSYWATLNGMTIGSSFLSSSYSSAKTHSVSRTAIKQGKNTLRVTVTNFGGNGRALNTAGLLYKLEIRKSGCVSCERIACKTIYSFNDTKPGDKGLDIFRLDVTGANAWACLFINNKADLENSRTNPEKKSGDSTIGANQGELSKFMQVFAWIDNDTNNLYSPGDTALFKGNLSAASPRFSIADTIGSYRNPIEAGKPKYIGIFWCFGNIIGIGNYTLQCDGSGPENNKAQTDIMKADFAFYAVQSSNNPSFKCNQSIII